MATLREVFSSIANAIRSKTGKTATIKPVDMATEIESIQTGGGDNKLPQLVDGSLTTITADDLVGATEVKNYAFYYSNIINITLPDSITSIGNSAFAYCSALTQITIPNSVTSIGTNVFQKCKSLTQVILSDSITIIRSNTFAYCSALMSIVIPNGVTSIDSGAFFNCSSLTSITLHDSVTSIGSDAFNKCSSLTSINIPANVTSIGNYALQIGTKTTKATITMKPTTPPTISSNTFNASYLNKIIVPVGCGDTYKSATNWSKFADYIEEATA